MRVDEHRFHGDSIEIEDVLVVADGEDVKIGQPLVEGAKVSAKIVEQGKAKILHRLLAAEPTPS